MMFEQASVGLEMARPSGSVPVLVDGTRMAQVVGNLLQNAVKFSSPGGRTRVSVGSSGGTAIIQVVDDGTGIAPDTLKQLFQPFMQAEQALDRNRGGLGLGLALVKGLVGLHDGSVSAHSDGLGKGAEFVVTLPLASRSLASIAVASSARPSRRIAILSLCVVVFSSSKTTSMRPIPWARR